MVVHCKECNRDREIIYCHSDKSITLDCQHIINAKYLKTFYCTSCGWFVVTDKLFSNCSECGSFSLSKDKDAIGLIQNTPRGNYD